MSLSNDDIKQLIMILQRGLSNEETETETQKTTKSTTTKRKKSQKKIEDDYSTNNIKTKKVKIQGSKNRFLDMPEMTMHKEDIEIDRILAKHPPTPRNRSFIPITVMCRVCGRKEEVNPVLVESAERYKCNRCSSSAG